MGLTLMNRLNRRGGGAGSAAGGGGGNGRNAKIKIAAAEIASKVAYKICGRKGGLS